MPSSPKSVEVPEAAVEALAKSLFRESDPFGYDWVEHSDHQRKGWMDRARTHLAAAQEPFEQAVEERVSERLEIGVLAGELQHIAERGCVPDGPKDGLAVDVLTWAEAWFLQLSAALNHSQDREEGQQ
jgi:hypothetical protein